MANSLFPTVAAGINLSPSAIEPKTTTVKHGRSWAFDFDKGDFVMTPTNRVAETKGVQAWVEWCKKAIATDRYRYLAYSRNYGQEYESVIGTSLPKGAIESEIRRMTEECLMVDPRTKSVDSFVFTHESDATYFTCRIMNIRGETSNIQGSVIKL